MILKDNECFDAETLFPVNVSTSEKYGRKSSDGACVEVTVATPANCINIQDNDTIKSTNENTFVAKSTKQCVAVNLTTEC